jgi:2-dehydro-3-deoxyphosphooctonate aldolase (KDO 8-P synthase)
MKQIQLDGIMIGGGAPFVLIAGPCVIEEEQKTMEIAVFLKELTDRLHIPLIFKASYDKANRTSVHSYRGPGLKKGLQILQNIGDKLSIPILTDVHRFEEIKPVSEVVDIVQVPAFLCRQTDFVMEVGRFARVINIKKGQFLAPGDFRNIIDKVRAVENENIIMTERGTCFGYNNLVADFRAIPVMRAIGYPVIFDATHSVQLPGGQVSYHLPLSP